MSLSIRDRAVRAVCALHASTGRATTTCEVGERTTAAVLAEVRVWLLEIAEARANECSVDSAAATAAAGDAKVLRSVADLVVAKRDRAVAA